jgi:gas vesicle protein
MQGSLFGFFIPKKNVKRKEFWIMNEDIAGKESSSLLVPVLVSGIVGAGLALLLTPKSGRDLRQDLRRYAAKTGEQASEAVEAGVEKAKDVYQESQATTAMTKPAATEALIGAESDGRSLVVPIVVSGVIGAAVALLFAPKPGSEIMDDIKDIAATAFEKSKVWYEQGAGAVKEAIEKGKEAAAETKEKLRPAA